MPANTGIQKLLKIRIPAFAGMTGKPDSGLFLLSIKFEKNSHSSGHGRPGWGRWPGPREPAVV